MIFALHLKVVQMNESLPESRWAVANGSDSIIAVCDSREQAERVRDKLYVWADALRDEENAAVRAATLRR